MVNALSLLIGWIADKLLGDPAWLPHPVVAFGKAIAWGERLLNRGRFRRWNGGFLAVMLIFLTFAATWSLLYGVQRAFGLQERPIIIEAILIFYCLAGTTLCREVRMVFEAADHSLEAGRRQVARIVGRDTTQLSDQEVRKAALETLAENLSDGVVAPLFWLLVGGVPGMMTYKMVNTLDSMIGYRTERYREFGTVAARIDDAANWIPARLTALLMVLTGGWGRRFLGLLQFVRTFGPQHASPNSGWPEAALAGILNCRFGGPHVYFGEVIEKPYIGDHERKLKADDMKTAIRVNQLVEVVMVATLLAIFYIA
jgi:adenosylcobinamide-phosphate synthase